MRSVLLALLLTALLADDGYSQQPSPRPPESGQDPQQQGTAETSQLNAAQVGTPPVSVTINNQTNAALTQPTPRTDSDNQDQQSSENGWSVTSIVTLMAVVVTAVATFFIAKYTLELSAVSRTQSKTLDATLAANKEIERAYVKMSHNRPGLRIDDIGVESASMMTGGDGISKQDIRINVKVQNAGNTPANVTCHLLHLCISNEPLPPVPPYDSKYAEVVRVSLVKEESFNIFGNFNVESSAIEHVTGDHTLKLYLLGYVDYIDKFGRRHRAGYARVYNPVEDSTGPFKDAHGHIDQKAYGQRNNLPFVTQPGYNYDRERKRENREGNDWDEPAQ